MTKRRRTSDDFVRDMKAKLEADPQTRAYLHALRDTVAKREQFASRMSNGERAGWLRECDQLLAQSKRRPRR